MNGFDSEEQLTRNREELEDATQRALELCRKIDKENFWDKVTAFAAIGLLVAYIAYLVYVAYGG